MVHGLVAVLHSCSSVEMRGRLAHPLMGQSLDRSLDHDSLAVGRGQEAG